MLFPKDWMELIIMINDRKKTIFSSGVKPNGMAKINNIEAITTGIFFTPLILQFYANEKELYLGCPSAFH